ncbi:hypothetical protein C4D60_Mb06t01230 [Musa balbisiana]|uniref:Uncharacterized protein n=1 Tax=Musa balbisiana TaxID=52838 RepID=A0A4S8IJV4_MUSBA|nr:hypothetical protein C4D60_Mb06t01230 [Musa balbisiana]
MEVAMELVMGGKGCREGGREATAYPAGKMSTCTGRDVRGRCGGAEEVVADSRMHRVAVKGRNAAEDPMRWWRESRRRTEGKWNCSAPCRHRRSRRSEVRRSTKRGGEGAASDPCCAQSLPALRRLHPKIKKRILRMKARKVDLFGGNGGADGGARHEELGGDCEGRVRLGEPGGVRPQAAVVKQETEEKTRPRRRSHGRRRGRANEEDKKGSGEEAEKEKKAEGEKKEAFRSC